jgi:5-methylcytosine-specific restriction endonuclease McrA
MSASFCFVQVNKNEIPIRIFRTQSAALKHEPYSEVRRWPKGEAVKEIRKQVVARAKGDCEYCGARVTPNTGQMHEDIFKGNGGEVSVSNGVFLCSGCHTGRADSEHGDRRWQTSATKGLFDDL